MRKLRDVAEVLRDIEYILMVVSRLFKAYRRWEERKILEARGYRREELKKRSYYDKTTIGFTAKRF